MTHSEINRGLPEGATPLDPDEAEDLLPSHIRTRGELNVWEQENILVAASWIRRTPRGLGRSDNQGIAQEDVLRNLEVGGAFQDLG